MKSRLFLPSVCLIAAGLLAATILVFTHLPNNKVPGLIVRIGDDKLRHVLSYGVLSALLFGGLRPWLPNPVKALAWVTVGGALFAIVDELTQPFTGRTCSLSDWFASVLGTVLGACMNLGTTLLWQMWFISRRANLANVSAASRKELPTSQAARKPMTPT